MPPTYTKKCSGKNKTKEWKINKAETSLSKNFNDANEINNSILSSVPKLTVEPALINMFLLNAHNNNNFVLKTVTETDILSCLKSIKSNATGVDKLSAHMLKMCTPYCLNPLTNIINFSLETGQIPELWKTALITPIPKKDNPTIMDLRPISILPTASKILEKVIKKQLVEYVEHNKILPKTQSGFRKNHSCTTALLKITNDITSCIDRGGCSPSVLIDMTKAFDCINKELLMAKLNYYNIKCGGLFYNYLHNRRQAVQLHTEEVTRTSDFQLLDSGVPQGSILGPILFSIFMADIQHVIKNSSYHMYADDLQIYLPVKIHYLQYAIIGINDDLTNISDWAKRNSLVINPLKTQTILFSKTEIDTSNLKIKLNNSEIKWSKVVKNLGLHMDSALSFDVHVSQINKKAYSSLKLLTEYKKFLPEDAKLTLVDSLVLSIPNSNDCVWFGVFAY